MKKNKQHKNIPVIKNNLYMLKLAFRNVPGLCVNLFFLRLFYGLFDAFFEIYLMKFVIDSVQCGRPVWQVMAFLTCYLIAGSVLQICESFFFEVYFPTKSLILSQIMQKDIFRKASEIEYRCYEDPTFYNDILLAASNADNKVMEVLLLTGDFIRSTVAAIGIISIITALDNLGLIFVAASLFFSILFNIWRNKLSYKKDIEAVPHQRKKDYIKRVFYFSDYVKELRLENMSNKLKEDFKQSNQNLIGIIRKYSNKFLGIHVLQDFVFAEFILNFVYMINLAYKAIITKSVSYGSLAALTGGLWNLKVNSQNIINILIKFHECSIYIERYKLFLNYQTKRDAGNPLLLPSSQSTIQLERVTFTYPGADRPALKDISLTIHPNQKIALVGYNGAGKTTLIKLILRLYEPDHGTIRLNGKDIREYDLKDYGRYFGTVFQDYKLFAASIAENVKMNIVKDEDIIEVNEALKKSDLLEKVTSLPNGVYTQLTKEFYDDGTNLSGGEAQKLAIARAFDADCLVYILDEPSSALDPINEYQFGQSLLQVSKNKSVIFISHRLSTTVSLDCIYMFEDGCVIESGSHQELIKQKGKYYEMFMMQSKKYQVRHCKVKMQE